MMREEMLALITIGLLLSGAVAYAEGEGADAEAIRALAMQEALEKAGEEAQELKDTIRSACLEDLYSSGCSCAAVPEEGKAECEAAIARAMAEAKERREELAEQCRSDLEFCNCDRLPTKYRGECEQEKASAKQIRAEMEGRCRRSPDACNCDMLEEGVEECRKAKDEAMGIAKKAIIRIFDECFRDVTACDCRGLFGKHLSGQYEDSILYCEEQRDYGLNCMRAGLDCDRMDSDKVIPAEVPDFLKPLVRQSLKSKIEKEKGRGVKAAMQVITLCLEKPEECDCSQTPVYAQEFCEHKKELQTRCFNDDYTACMEIDAEPLVPDYLPEFSRGIIAALVEKLKDAQKSIVLASASKKVGNAILGCMDSAATCDCSVAPQGKFRAFCEHKKGLIGQCRDERVLDACFTLDQEPVMPEGVPQIIMNHIEKNILPVVEEKKQAMYDEMRGGNCEGLTIPQCKEFCDQNECTI